MSQTSPNTQSHSIGKELRLSLKIIVLTLGGGFVLLMYLILVLIWGNWLFAYVPAQVQITVDRRGMSPRQLSELLFAFGESNGFSGTYNAHDDRSVLLNRPDYRHLQIRHDYPAASIDLAYSLISVTDWNNENVSPAMARDLAQFLAEHTTILRIYVQIDPKKNDCNPGRCAFEMTTPIDLSQMPFWCGKRDAWWQKSQKCYRERSLTT
jgi:hypothetical protein